MLIYPEPFSRQWNVTNLENEEEKFVIPRMATLKERILVGDDGFISLIYGMLLRETKLQAKVISTSLSVFSASFAAFLADV